jgi:hypothetical protein
MKALRIALVVALAIASMTSAALAAGAQPLRCAQPPSAGPVGTVQLEIVVGGELDCSTAIHVSPLERAYLSHYFAAWAIDLSTNRIGTQNVPRGVEVYVDGLKQNVCPGAVELRPGMRITVIAETAR